MLCTNAINTSPLPSHYEQTTGVIHENRKYITYRNAPQEKQAKYRQILFQVLKTQIGFKI